MKKLVLRIVRPLTPQYDIFKVFGIGNPAWLESAQTLDEALARVERFSKPYGYCATRCSEVI